MKKMNDSEEKSKEIKWGWHWLMAFWVLVGSFAYNMVMMPVQLKGGTITRVEEVYKSFIEKLDKYDAACADSSYKVFIKHEREIERLYVMLDSMFLMRNDP